MNHWPTDAQFVQFEDEGLLLDLSEKDYMKNIDSKYLDAVKEKTGKITWLHTMSILWEFITIKISLKRLDILCLPNGMN